MERRMSVRRVSLDELTQDMQDGEQKRKNKLTVIEAMNLSLDGRKRQYVDSC